MGVGTFLLWLLFFCLACVWEQQHFRLLCCCFLWQLLGNGLSTLTGPVVSIFSSMCLCFPDLKINEHCLLKTMYQPYDYWHCGNRYICHGHSGMLNYENQLPCLLMTRSSNIPKPWTKTVWKFFSLVTWDVRLVLDFFPPISKNPLSQ